LTEAINFFCTLSEEEISLERSKARKLRKTRWWRRKCASGKCHYCGRTVGAGNLTMDHMVPLARGGRSTRSNLVPACKECNSSKQAKLAFEWEDYLSRNSS